VAKKPTLEEEQRALNGAMAEPRSTAARHALDHALLSKRSHLAARAASLIQRHHLDGFDDALRAVFERFLQDPIKSDPGCAAKLAAIEALDYGESAQSEPFWRAARHVQLEPSWGPPVDTAAPLRARGLLALARLGDPDFALLAAERLADPESPVRQSAADALAHHGSRAGAPLALLKLRLGDEDPLVHLAAMSALLSLAPEWGLAELGPLLMDEPRRELAAVALGQSRLDDALKLLLDALERCVRPVERAPILRGIGLHRSDAALAALLDTIAAGSARDAETAIVALGARRFEPGLADKIRAAAARNPRADLTKILAETFSD
jgi:HEAT repeat protein